jgi:thioredoxin 1
MQECSGTELDLRVDQEPDALTIVYLWGHDCPNCEVFKNHLPEIGRELEGLPFRFLKVNVYDEPEVARRFGVYGIPTFLLYRHGKLIGKMTSFQGVEYFVTVVREQTQ